MSSTMMPSPPVPAASATGTAANASILALATMGLSSNKYVLGIMILLINLGARYIGNELNEFSHKVLNHKFARRFLIFLVIWMGSRDLLVAFIITAGFIIISNTLLNEQSSLCILPVETPSPITKEEYDVAKQLVDKYEKSHPAMPVAVGMVPNTPPKANTNANPMNPLPINNNQVNKS